MYRHPVAQRVERCQGSRALHSHDQTRISIPTSTKEQRNPGLSRGLDPPASSDTLRRVLLPSHPLCRSQICLPQKLQRKHPEQSTRQSGSCCFLSYCAGSLAPRAFPAIRILLTRRKKRVDARDK
jgi:hypothetical protein